MTNETESGRRIDNKYAELEQQLRDIADSCETGEYRPARAKMLRAAADEFARLAATTQASTAQAECVNANLYGAIMNLPAKYEGDANFRRAYLSGHRDARHAAAELVSTQEAATSSTDAAPTFAEAQAEEAKLYHDLTGDAMALGFDGIVAALEALKVAQAAAEVRDAWISVDERLPKCSKKPGSFGVEVIVYPRPEKGESTAFFGCRHADDPDFYKYGSRVGGVTHWMPLPEAPVAIRSAGDTGGVK